VGDERGHSTQLTPAVSARFRGYLAPAIRAFDSHISGVDYFDHRFRVEQERRWHWIEPPEPGTHVGKLFNTQGLRLARNSSAT
jgi:hypothetical protein